MSQRMRGVVESIHIADVHGGPVRPLRDVQATAGVGLAGDRDHRDDGDSPGRDLTLIEAEEIEGLAHNHGINLAPGETRRNITTRGIRLNDLVGKEFWVGDVLVRGVKINEPCQYLQELVGKPILRPLAHRAGIRADMLTSGRISVGDRIEEKE